MKKITMWSVCASIFCSLSLADVAYEAAHGPLLASFGNSERVERSLANMVTSMGASDTSMVIHVPVASGSPVFAGNGSNQGAAEVSKDSLSPMVDWVLDKGKAGAVTGYIAKAMNLGDQNILVRHKGFQTIADKTLHIVSVSTQNGHEDVFISHLNADSTGTVWLTSRLGEIRVTVVIPELGTAKVVPNSDRMGEFEDQKNSY